MKNKTDCAIILAAGFGERFLPITETIPKPALPFLNKPMICWTLEQLINYGVKKVFVNLHHLSDLIIKALNPYREKIEIVFSFEETILGTYGLFSKFKKSLPEKFFVLNSDVFLKIPFYELDQFFAEKENLDAVLLLRKKRKSENYTSFLLDKHLVRKMGEGCHHFCGIYIAKKSFLRFAGEEKKMNLPDILKEELQKNLLGGMVFKKEWLDLGTPKNYLNSTKICLKRMAENKFAIPKGNKLTEKDGFAILTNKDSYISKSTKLDGFVVLGKKSRIESKKSVGNVVLLENSVMNISKKIRNAIVFENGILFSKMDKKKNSR